MILVVISVAQNAADRIELKRVAPSTALLSTFNLIEYFVEFFGRLIRVIVAAIVMGIIIKLVDGLICFPRRVNSVSPSRPLDEIGCFVDICARARRMGQEKHDFLYSKVRNSRFGAVEVRFLSISS